MRFKQEGKAALEALKDLVQNSNDWIFDKSSVSLQRLYNVMYCIQYNYGMAGSFGIKHSTGKSILMANSKLSLDFGNIVISMQPMWARACMHE